MIVNDCFNNHFECLKTWRECFNFTEGKYYFSLRKDVSARCKLTFLCNKVDSLLKDTLNWSLPCFDPFI